MSTIKSTGGAHASFSPEQRGSLVEVVTLLRSYIAGHASVDCALLLAAIRARRGGIDALDFVATVKALAPTVSVPAALLAWLERRSARRDAAAGSAAARFRQRRRSR